MRLELTLPALERLIGGDTDLEVKLRSQIAQEFAKRHLKEVAESASYTAALEEVKQHVNQVVKEHLGIENLVTNNLWPTINARLKSVFEAQAREHAQKAIDEALAGLIKYQRSYWGKEIGNAVDKAINAEIDKIVEERIRRRLEAAKTISGMPV